MLALPAPSHSSLAPGNAGRAGMGAFAASVFFSLGAGYFLPAPRAPARPPVRPAAGLPAVPMDRPKFPPPTVTFPSTQPPRWGTSGLAGDVLVGGTLEPREIEPRDRIAEREAAVEVPHAFAHVRRPIAPR